MFDIVDYSSRAPLPVNEMRVIGEEEEKDREEQIAS